MRVSPGPTRWRLVITPTAVINTSFTCGSSSNSFRALSLISCVQAPIGPAEHGHHDADGAERGPAAMASTVTGPGARHDHQPPTQSTGPITRGTAFASARRGVASDLGDVAPSAPIPSSPICRAGFGLALTVPVVVLAVLRALLEIAAPASLQHVQPVRAQCWHGLPLRPGHHIRASIFPARFRSPDGMVEAAAVSDIDQLPSVGPGRFWST
jgi:hypothetical protein